jgi:hypothetical protein
LIVWQGLGAAAFVIPFGVMLIVGLTGPALIGQATFAQYGRIIVGASLLVGALLVHLLARRLALRPSRVLIDKATGQEVTLRERHTMWFIPIRYWAFFWAILGLVLIVAGIVIGSD